METDSRARDLIHRIQSQLTHAQHGQASARNDAERRMWADAVRELEEARDRLRLGSFANTPEVGDERRNG